MSTVLALADVRSVVIGSDGVGEIFHVGPRVSFETWRVTRVQTTCDSDEEARLYMYRGAINPSNMIAGTYSGNLDTNETDITLKTGEFLSFRYAEASAGAVGTIRVEGEKMFPEGLIY